MGSSVAASEPPKDPKKKDKDKKDKDKKEKVKDKDKKDKKSKQTSVSEEILELGGNEIIEIL